MDAWQPEWTLDRSETVSMGAGEQVEVFRADVWFLVRDGSVEARFPAGTEILSARDAGHFHRAPLLTLRAVTPATVVFADLRHSKPGSTDPLIVRDFQTPHGGIVELVTRCPVSAAPRFTPAVRSAFGELLGSAMVSAHDTQTLGRDTWEERGDRVIAEVCRAVSEMPERSWTLGDMARLAHVGSSTLVARFRETTGLSPMQYVRRARVQLAIDRLDASDAPVGLVATAVGYGSTPAFTRAFRSVTGISPQQWRQSCRGTTFVEAKTSAPRAAAAIPS